MLNTKYLTLIFPEIFGILNSLSYLCIVKLIKQTPLTTTTMETTKKTFAPFYYVVLASTMQTWSQIVDLNVQEWTREALKNDDEIHVKFDGETITAEINGSHLFDRTDDTATIADLYVVSKCDELFEQEVSVELSCTTADLVAEGWHVDWADESDTKISYYLNFDRATAKAMEDQKALELRFNSEAGGGEPIVCVRGLSRFGGLSEFHKLILKYA